MKKLYFLNLVLVLLLSVFSVTEANAQGEPEDGRPDRPPADEPDNRVGLLRELGLTQDQIRQIRRLNVQRRPLVQEAQKNLRIATRNLDQAIYADAIDEAAIQLRLREVQLAHAEIAKIRANNELEIRKILTPEQLARFKDLRQRMMNRIQDRRGNRPPGPGQAPPNDRPPTNAPNRPRPDKRPGI